MPSAAPLGEHGEGTPLVSVVLATFNRVSLLEDTLRTVLAQTHDDFELIVCDDGSADGTPVVMAEWAARDPRILYVRQPRNLGLAGNVRSGIALAKAELVAVLYDGDVYDPRLLERWVAALRACPEAAFVFNAYQPAGPGRRDRGDVSRAISVPARRAESFSNASTSGAGISRRPSGGP